MGERPGPNRRTLRRMVSSPAPGPLDAADLRQRVQKALDACKSSLSKIRTGRAHVGLLDHIHVDYYGTSTPLNQVANVTLLDARTLGVTVWEKNMATVVDKAIRDSDLGLNPQSQGTVIRVPMPPMSEERRKEMTKLVRSEAENAKVAIRNLRRDANEQVKKLVKDKIATEDELKRAEGDVQKVTDEFIAAIDSALKGKEAEIMEV